MSGSVQKREMCWIPQNVAMRKNMFKDVWGIVVVFCWSVFVMNMGCKGPDLDDLLELPDMIQKVSEYVRGPKLAILE